MTDSKFGFKSSAKETQFSIKGFTGSLGLRVYFISIIFLVFPLLIYSLVMYRYNFIFKKSAEAQRLRIVSQNEVKNFSELTQFMLEKLEIISIYLSTVTEEKEINNINEEFSRIVGFTGFSSIFILSNENGQANYTHKSLMNKENAPDQNDINTIINTKPLGDFFISTNETNDQYRFIFYSKILERKDGDINQRVLTISITSKFFLDYLSKTQGDEDFFHLALFDAKTNKIFESQKSALIGKRISQEEVNHRDLNIISLNEIPKEPNSFEFTIENKSGYATILTLPLFNFNVLIFTFGTAESTYLRNFYTESIFFFLSVLLFGGLGATLLTAALSKPFKRLVDLMKKVSENDLSARYEDSSFGFEINKLGQMLNTMLENIILNLKNLEEQRLKKEKLQQELLLGQTIQKSLVPKKLPFVEGLELEAVLIPAKDVGGDFYDFFINPQNQDEMFVLIADTAGHGVYGCFYSLSMRSILRTICSSTNDLVEIAKTSNSLFYKDSEESGVFVTVWIGLYNLKTRVLSYTSCGHPLGFLFRNSTMSKELTTAGIALGVIPEIDVEVATAQLELSDVVILVTDGVTETRNIKGELYGKSRLAKAVEKCSRGTAFQIMEGLTTDAEAFEEDPMNQDDDFTAVVIKIK